MTEREQINTIVKRHRLNETMVGVLVGLANSKCSSLTMGTNAMYSDVPSGAGHALIRRGLCVQPSQPGSTVGGYSGGSIALSQDGRPVAAELAVLFREMERKRIASLDLSPPRRGHLRVVLRDE